MKLGIITVCGDQWPTMLYSGVYDSSDPWNGLLRNYVLVRVRKHCFEACGDSHLPLKAYKHIFTSPSSVDSEPKATRSGNARIHGMLCATRGSIAYIATQVYPLLYDYTCLLTFNSEVRFALSSSSVFSRTDKICDSERFYNSLLELLYDPEEQKEVEELLSWWNR